MALLHHIAHADAFCQNQEDSDRQLDIADQNDMVTFYLAG